MPWAHLPGQEPVVPHSDGLHPMVPRQGAALLWHKYQIQLAGTQGPVWVYVKRWDMLGRVGNQVRKSPFSPDPLYSLLLPKQHVCMMERIQTWHLSSSGPCLLPTHFQHIITTAACLDTLCRDSSCGKMPALLARLCGSKKELVPFLPCSSCS